MSKYLISPCMAISILFLLRYRPYKYNIRTEKKLTRRGRIMFNASAHFPEKQDLNDIVQHVRLRGHELFHQDGRLVIPQARVIQQVVCLLKFCCLYLIKKG